MAADLQRTCDGCGAVVHGKLNGRFTHRDYINIKGSMVLQLMDLKTQYKEFIYLTRPPSGDLYFCLQHGLPCMQTFIDTKRGLYNFHKQQRLKEQATGEHAERLETGGYLKTPTIPYDPDFVVGTKKDGKFHKR